MISAILTTFSVLGAAYASSVQPVVAPNGCYNIPSYYPYTGTTGYFMLTVSGCVNGTATDKACSIEGFRDTTVTTGDNTGHVSTHAGPIPIYPPCTNRPIAGNRIPQ